MRVTLPKIEGDNLPYSTLKIQGCTDIDVGFDILDSNPTVSKRRYCNKVLVHECVSVPVVDPMVLERAEFMATADPCYSVFNVFKSSIEIDEVPPTVTLQLNDDDLVIGVIVHFVKTETCCLPLRMSYRLYGYIDADSRVLLANGNLYVTPCSCSSGVPEPDGTCVDCGGDYWTDVDW